MKSLLWTLVLLLLIFYCFGVLLTQIVVDYCRDETIQLTGDANAVPVCGEILSKYWSNIVQSMLTLFMAITGGISWIEALEPLQTISFFAVLFFIFYIIVTVFAVMNVATWQHGSGALVGTRLCGCVQKGGKPSQAESGSQRYGETTPGVAWFSSIMV